MRVCQRQDRILFVILLDLWVRRYFLLSSSVGGSDMQLRLRTLGRFAQISGLALCGWLCFLKGKYGKRLSVLMSSWCSQIELGSKTQCQSWY